MADKTNITVVLPVHELNESVKNLLPNAIQSVNEQEVLPDEFMLVIDGNNDELKKYINDFEYPENIKPLVNIVENTGDTNFAAQINYGVSQVKTDWFSILEFDDEFANIWLKNATKYKDVYTDVDVFLPIVVDVNTNDEWIGFTNEAVWAKEFSDEMGILDNTALLNYQNFNLDGMVMKKETFEEFGGLKESIELTFIYEFFLRISYNDTRIMTIPKFGYKHVNQREGSLFHEYQENMRQDEAKWWLNQAKKEYFFTKDRKIRYEEETTE